MSPGPKLWGPIHTRWTSSHCSVVFLPKHWASAYLHSFYIQFSYVYIPRHIYNLITVVFLPKHWANIYTALLLSDAFWKLMEETKKARGWTRQLESIAGFKHCHHNRIWSHYLITSRKAWCLNLGIDEWKVYPLSVRCHCILCLLFNKRRMGVSVLLPNFMHVEMWMAWFDNKNMAILFSLFLSPPQLEWSSMKHIWPCKSNLLNPKSQSSHFVQWMVHLYHITCMLTSNWPFYLEQFILS